PYQGSYGCGTYGTSQRSSLPVDEEGYICLNREQMSCGNDPSHVPCERFSSDYENIRLASHQEPCTDYENIGITPHQEPCTDYENLGITTHQEPCTDYENIGLASQQEPCTEWSQNFDQNIELSQQETRTDYENIGQEPFTEWSQNF
ncbi:hypothetical protein Ahia01_000535100, partial [Argonauta hians]